MAGGVLRLHLVPHWFPCDAGCGRAARHFSADGYRRWARRFGPTRPGRCRSIGDRLGRLVQPRVLNADPVQRISSYAAGLGLSQPLLGNFGNLGRNTFRLNGERNFNLNIGKSFALHETAAFQIRAEFYNAFNNTSFQDVNRNITQAALRTVYERCAGLAPHSVGGTLDVSSRYFFVRSLRSCASSAIRLPPSG